MANLIFLPNPFNPDERDIKEIQPTKSAYSLLKDFDYDTDLYDIVIVKNDTMQEADFEIIEGDIVVFSLIPQGGGDGGGKDTVRSIALIVVAIIAAAVTDGAAEGFFGEGTLSAYSTGAIAAGVTIGVGGSLLINALLPPQLPKFDAGNYGLDAYSLSPTYSFNPDGNIYRDGFTVPVLYGTRKVTPPIISRYIEIINNKQYLHMLLAVAEGEIDSITDIRINDNPISYFQNVSYETRLGTNTQDPITDFEDIRSTQQISQPMKKDVPRQVQTNGNSVTGLNVCIVASQGLWYANDSGGLSSNSVTFTLEYSADGITWTRFPTAYTTTQTQTGWIDDNSNTYDMSISVTNWGGNYYYNYDTNDIGNLQKRVYPTYISGVADYATITAAQQSQLIYSYKVSGLTAGRYYVRATRLSTEQTSSRYGDSIYLWYMDEITDYKIAYRNTALLAVRAMASEQINGDPVITCTATKNLNNPADVIIDMLTNERYGGDKSLSRIIESQFDDLRDYCNENNLKVNVYFDTPISLQKAIELISAVGYSVLSRRGSNFGVLIDKPDPSAMQAFMFTHGSILRDSFKLSYVPLKDRANVIELTYYDETLDYAPQTIEVTQGLYDSNNEVNKTTMQLLATTDRQQSINEARRRLNYNRYLTKTATFDAFTNSITCNTNQIVKVCHTRLLPYNTSGRIVSATNDTVTLDVPVTLDVGKNYAIEIKNNDDDSHIEAMVTSVDVTGYILTVNPSFSVVPPQYSEYAFGEVDMTTLMMKIVSIGYDQNGRRQISAIEYLDDIYTADTNPIIYPDVSGTRITAILISDYIRVATDGGIETIVQLSWNGNLIAYKVWYKKSTDTAWTLGGTTSNNTIDLLGLQDGETYDFVVGGAFDDSNKQTYTVKGKFLPPPSPTNLLIEDITSTKKNLVWTYPPPPADFAGFEIRLASGATTKWNYGQKINVGKVTVTNYLAEISLYGVCTLMVKALDTSGIYSENMTYATLNNGDIIANNLVQQVDYHPTFDGTISNMTIDSGKLFLYSDSNFWRMSDSNFWRLTDSDFWGESGYKNGYFIGHFEAETAGYLKANVVADGAYTILYRKSVGDGDFWNGLNGSDFWENYGSDMWLQPEFVPYISAFVCEQRGYDFKIEFQSQTTSTPPKITEFSIINDMPDIIETFNDLPISSAGTRLPLTKTFTAIKNIKITVQDDGNGGLSGVYLNKNPILGPLIEVRDATNTAVNGIADITIQGY